MRWLPATITLDLFLFPNNSPPLDHYLPSPYAVICLVYLRRPPLDPNLPPQPLSRRPKPHPCPSRFQSEFCQILSPSRGNVILFSPYSVPFHLILWENKTIMLWVLKTTIQRGWKCKGGVLRIEECEWTQQRRDSKIKEGG